MKTFRCCLMGTTITLYDITGKCVITKTLLGALDRINVSDLKPGLYLYSVSRGSSRVSSGKIIVRGV
jgi:hypothetical protein